MQLTDTLTRRELSKLVLEKCALKAMTKRRGPVCAARAITACCATFDSGSLHDVDHVALDICCTSKWLQIKPHTNACRSNARRSWATAWSVDASRSA
jgi:hypothetical protein